jgi:F420H(2)-dependent quinone reductase
MADEARLPPKRIIRFFTALNVLIYRLSGGRLMNRHEGAPICLVTMTGRRSGRKKTIALMYTRHGEDVLLVASLGGSPAHPVWYHNLKAQPQIEIQAGRVRRKMLAREAPAEEKRALWPVVVANYPSFDAYQKRTTREIPLFICSPRSG